MNRNWSLDKICFVSRRNRTLEELYEESKSIYPNPYPMRQLARLNELLGVVAVDSSLCDISRSLKTIELGKTGQAFITESSELVVATFTREVPYTDQSKGRASPHRGRC